MLLIVAFLLGAVAGGAVVLMCKPTPAATPTPFVSDADRRRAERAMREYRNFLTYDGFSGQEDQS